LDTLGAEFHKLMPQLYKDRAKSQGSLSPINAAWHEAMVSLCSAHQAVEALTKLLVEKADACPVPEPCPFVASAAADIHIAMSRR
jgi:hypothetical protein